jgi:hypothetical protein
MKRALICSLDLGFCQNENGQTKEVFDLSSMIANLDYLVCSFENKTRNLRCGSPVARTGHFSNRFLADLQLVSSLNI